MNLPENPVLVITPDGAEFKSLVQTDGGSLKFLQAEVEGYVDVIQLGQPTGVPSSRALDMWVNDEGTYTKADCPNLPATVLASTILGHAPYTTDGIIYGNVVVAMSDSEGRTVPLTGGIMSLFAAFVNLVNA